MLEHFEKLTSIVIPEYIRDVEVSKAQNPKYFEWNHITIKAKNKPLWKACIRKDVLSSNTVKNEIITPEDLRPEYKIIGFKGSKVYCIYPDLDVYDLTQAQLKRKTKHILCKIGTEGDIDLGSGFKATKVIANRTQAGTPNRLVISGQYIYSGVYNKFAQGKIIHAIKRMYFDKFNTFDIKVLFLIRKVFNRNYPLLIICEIEDTIKKFNDNTKEGYGKAWDVSNLAYPYLKVFSDFLVGGYKNEETNESMEGFIIDDDRLHIMGDMSIFTPIEEGQQHKMIFHIYADKRTVWNNININNND